MSVGYQSKARMRLSISDLYWHPISYRFEVIADCCSNFGHFAFWASYVGLMSNVRCSS